MDFAKYTIITPDGESLDLNDAGFTVGIGDIQDGMGLPPVDHKSWNLYNNPGGFLRSIQVGIRTVTISVTLNADCLIRLHDLRNKLWKVLRWNRTLSNPPDPAILRYTLHGKSADLYVYYGGDVIARSGDSNTTQIVGVRLIAYDPLWYDHEQKSSVFELIISTTVRTIVEKELGQWSTLGPPDVAGTYNAVYAIAEDENYVYVGGNFLNFNNIANADYIVRYNKSTNTWHSMGSGIDGSVFCIAVSSTGDIYVGGTFTNAGGVACNCISRWNTISEVWSNIGNAVGGVPFSQILSIAIDRTGNILAGGRYTSIGGVAASNIAYRTTAGVWTAMGAGVDNNVHAIAISKNNDIFVAGDFLNAGGSAATRIARWNGSSWSTLGSGINGTGRCLAIDLNGILFVGGDFTTAGGVSANYVAGWNGVSFFPLGNGTNASVYSVSISSNGNVYFGGAFTIAGNLSLADSVAVWNRTAWSMIDADLPGIVSVYSLMSPIDDDYGIWIGFNTTGTAYFSNSTICNTNGDFESFPIFKITGPGILQHILNETSNEQLKFNMYVNPGETITIDISPGIKSITSSWSNRPGAFGDLSISQSDLGDWSLKPIPVAPNGNNMVNIFMTSTTPVDYNDNNSQLDHYENMTGVTCENTGDNGILYVSIIADGGGFYHIEFYTDAARTALVAHTGTYNAIGAKAITADNGSGIGGTITVDAVVGADADIYAYFATVCMTYYNRHLSIDHAMQ